MTHSWIIALLLVSLAPLAAADKDPQPVQIKTADGKTITAKLYGDGKTALILCHGRSYRNGGESFAEQCRHFQQKEIACLAIDFRGYPSESLPDVTGLEQDVIAAFDFLVQRGGERIYILGSSMGGSATLDALRTLDGRKQLAGIIIISAADPEACARARCRKLFIVAENDPAGSFAGVKAMHASASEPKQLVTFEIGGHGQSLFKSRGTEMLNAIGKFIEDGAK